MWQSLGRAGLKLSTTAELTALGRVAALTWLRAGRSMAGKRAACDRPDSGAEQGLKPEIPAKGHHMSVRAIPAILLLTLFLSSCGKPVPADKADYVGQWRAPEMYLKITQDGSIEYERLKEGRKTSITGPLQGFQGDDFSVGISSGISILSFPFTRKPMPLTLSCQSQIARASLRW